MDCPKGKTALYGATRIRILPGQYYDEETGLHYNWNRYYDPSTGRYITPDPIGLAGGLNLFSYVQNNPINRIDPRGLIEVQIGPDIPDIGPLDPDFNKFDVLPDIPGKLDIQPDPPDLSDVFNLNKWEIEIKYECEF
jgi:RHS repeat-associated protein